MTQNLFKFLFISLILFISSQLDAARALPLEPVNDDLSIYSEFLYLKGDLENSEFAAEETFSDSGIIGAQEVFDTHDKKKGFNTQFDPAFRVGIYYLWCGDCWDTDLNWMHYQSSRSETLSGTVISNDPFVDNTPFIFFPIRGSFNEINAHLKLKVDDVQWSIGRQVFVSTCFAFRPYVAAKYLDIQEKFNIKASRTERFQSRENAKLHTCYRGAGLQGGFDLTWQVGCGLSLYSNVNAGIVYGRVQAKSVEQSIFLDGITFIQNNGSNFNSHYARPNLDLGIGISYQSEISCQPFTLWAGWEYHHYFGQNMLRLTDFVDTRGDLTLHGATVGISIAL